MDSREVLLATGILLFAAAFLLARLLFPLLERQARKVGLVDHPGGRKKHQHEVPLVGGIGVLLAVVVPAVGGLVAALAGGEGFLPKALAQYLPGIRQRAPELLAILSGSGLLLLVGYLDDRRSLPVAPRLLCQVLAALLVVSVGVRVTLFLPWSWLQVLVSIFYLVFITNAVNFIDNINGLMPGVVAISALHLLTLALATGQLFLCAILLSLLGGLLAFLPRNFPRARAFSGDAGSTALGFLLGAITMVFTFESRGFSLRPVLLPLLLLAVPVGDGVTVIVSRLRRGVHPATAGRDHLSHRLLKRGLSPVASVLLLWGAAFLLGLPAPLLGGASLKLLLLVFGPAVLLALLLLHPWATTREG